MFDRVLNTPLNVIFCLGLRLVKSFVCKSSIRNTGYFRSSHRRYSAGILDDCFCYLKNKLKGASNFAHHLIRLGLKITIPLSKSLLLTTNRFTTNSRDNKIIHFKIICISTKANAIWGFR